MDSISANLSGVVNAGHYLQVPAQRRVDQVIEIFDSGRLPYHCAENAEIVIRRVADHDSGSINAARFTHGLVGQSAEVNDDAAIVDERMIVNVPAGHLTRSVDGKRLGESTGSDRA